ncbi:MAG: type IV secretion system protein VirB3 [Acetobacteraceae bacterium]|nr:type IV secretion system protein VirB3 [Acetobacteraceae bacterium]
MEDEPLLADPLFLACTRPAMWHGVPVEAVGLNVMATTVLFVVMENPLWMGCALVVHLAMRALVARDAHAFGTLRLWAETKGRARNVELWGGSSVGPLPLGPARRPREVRVHA